MVHPKNSGSSDRNFGFKIPHKVSQDEGTFLEKIHSISKIIAEDVRAIRITMCVLSIGRFGLIRKYLFQTAPKFGRIVRIFR